MSKKQFSMNTYWSQVFAELEPEWSFKKSSLDFEEWAEKSRAKLLELMGSYPERVPLNAEVESIEDCGSFERRRVVFDSEKHMSVPCYVLVPKGLKKDHSNPAILCSHGHGAFGKDPVAGLRLREGHLKDIKKMNYNYGEQMAEAGFITICPDLRGFGERGKITEKIYGHDYCDINFVKGAMIGSYSLTLNIWDMKCCIDYLETMPEVDPNRIGMMGLSQGGTMTTFTAAVEPRIKAADIIGYVNPFVGFAIDRGNFCGAQMLPHIYSYFDTYDIAGMIAPRPLLLEMGKQDDCFFFDDMMTGYHEVSKIYEAASAGDKLHADIHEGGHAFSGNKAFEFFKKYL
ncbi:MAG: alpha/beta hydrolase family protein [Oliverpabstia sp.]